MVLDLKLRPKSPKKHSEIPWRGWGQKVLSIARKEGPKSFCSKGGGWVQRFSQIDNITVWKLKCSLQFVSEVNRI